MAPNLWDVVSAKLARPGGYGRLSDDEKLWVNIRTLIDTTTERGIAGYFRGPQADHFADLLAALDEMDAPDAREQLLRVATMFGDPFPVENAARIATTDGWNEESFGVHRVLDEADAVLAASFEDLEEKLQSFLEDAGLAGLVR